MELTDSNVELVKTPPMSDLKKGESGIVIYIKHQGFNAAKVNGDGVDP